MNIKWMRDEIILFLFFFQFNVRKEERELQENKQQRRQKFHNCRKLIK